LEMDYKNDILERKLQNLNNWKLKCMVKIKEIKWAID